MENQGCLSTKVCLVRLICDEESSLLSALPLPGTDRERQKRRAEGLSLSAVPHLLQFQIVLVCKWPTLGRHIPTPFTPLVPSWSWSLGYQRDSLPAPPPTQGCAWHSACPGVLTPESTTSQAWVQLEVQMELCRPGPS